VPIRNWHQNLVGEPIIAGTSYNIINAARTLAENNPGIVVFYDPIAGYVDYTEMRHEELAQAARDESEKMLRKQVEAFIAWLVDGGF